MTKRNLLQSESTISLHRERDFTDRKSVFKINSILAEGGSSVCYNAQFNGVDGILKEFYPDYIEMSRTSDGYLIPLNSDSGAFNERCECYVEAHQSARKIKNICNYIPYIEIFYSCSGDNISGSVYIWNPNPMVGIDFQKYLEIQKKERKAGIVRLYEAFSILTTLTESVSYMHKAGLAHQDLKPSNFLIAEKDRKIDSSHISLFDLDTIYDAKSKHQILYTAGTEGFAAPEIKRGIVNHKTDIYSIAAIIYYVLCDCERTFNDNDYYEIEKIISESKLVKNASFERKQEWLTIVTSILKNNLSDISNKRAKSCDELLPKMKALTEILLVAYKEKEEEKDSLFSLYANGNKEDYLEQELILQNLLFRRPLYNYLSDNIEKGKRELRIIVVGLRENGRRFLKVALQAAQMPDIVVSVVIYAENLDKEKQSYLNDNPLFSEFFEVDPESKDINDTVLDLDTEEYYGRVFFRQLPKNLSGDPDASQIEIMNSAYYAFIDLERDSVNKDIAETLAAPDKNCCCSYVWYNDEKRSYLYEHQKKYLFPICMRYDKRKEYISSKLEHLAENAHMIWEKKPSDKELLDNPYYFNSSVSYVLSIPYKLYYAGITYNIGKDSRLSDDLKVAEAFFDYISDTANNTKLKIMAAYEHRRWVIEKITDGWTRIETYDYCNEADPNKNKQNKRHCCLVKGNADIPLSEEEYQKDGCRKWDCSVDTKLDELDKVSILIHQERKRRVKEATYGKSPNQYITKLSDCFPEGWNENSTLYNAFCIFACGFRSIWHGDRIYANEYKQNREEFTKIIKQQITDTSIIASLEGCLKKIDDISNAIQRSLEHMDFKMNDRKLLNNLPFIMANRPVDRLALVLRDNINVHDVYSNVISVAMLKPDIVDYVYCCCPSQNVALAEILEKKIISILSYFNKNKIDVHCNFYIAVPKEMYNVSQKLKDFALSGKLQNIKNRIHIMLCESIADGAIQLAEKLNEIKSNNTGKFLVFDATTQMFETEFPTQFNDERFLFECAVKGYPGKKSNWPYFVLNWLGKSHNRFVRCNGCEELKFIRKKDTDVYFRAMDLFLLNDINYVPVKGESDLGEICDELWKIYRGEDLAGDDIQDKHKRGRERWNTICNCIAGLEQRDTLLLQKTNTKEIEKRFLFNGDYFKAVSKILKALKEYGFAEEESNISFESDDLCKLYICSKYMEVPEKVFGFIRTHELINSDLLTCEYLNNILNIKHIRLKWQNAPLVDNRGNKLTRNSYNTGDLMHAFNILEKKGYLYRPGTAYIFDVRNSTEPSLNFAYASESIRNVLSKAGELLEIYIYRQLHKSGYFTEVVRGQTVQWLSDKPQICNEFDLIATKGFHSVFIECKGRSRIDQDVYFKIKQLTDYFGNRSKCVVISTADESETDTNNKTKAELMNIITIGDSDIENTAEILRKKMKD